MQRKKVYNLFQINLIVFYSLSLMMVPMLLVVAYIFDLHQVTSVNNIILIADILTAIFFIVGLVYLLVSRDQLERKLKPSYHKEFTTILTISAFGILGIGILYTYLGGKLFYVPHVIVPIFIVVYLLIFIVGDKFFNVSVFKK